MSLQETRNRSWQYNKSRNSLLEFQNRSILMIFLEASESSNLSNNRSMIQIIQYHEMIKLGIDRDRFWVHLNNSEDQEYRGQLTGFIRGLSISLVLSVLSYYLSLSSSKSAKRCINEHKYQHKWTKLEMKIRCRELRDFIKRVNSNNQSRTPIHV